MTDALALARLVRLPSVLTVPGDTLLGSSWGGEVGEAAGPDGLVLASSLLYLSGMALNDWADRDTDALERPQRPIPSGAVTPAVALSLASGLSGASLVVAGAVGGPTALRTALPLAVTVWSYDLVAKGTPAGPWAMALARTLDVLLGAGRSPRRAAPAAAIIGAHTLIVTFVSRREAEGASPRLATGALAGVAATAAATAALALRKRRSDPLAAGAALVCVGLYASALGSAGLAAVRDPQPAQLQRMVGAGVLALMPLQAALLALRGRPGAAAGIVAAWPLARRAARKAAVT